MNQQSVAAETAAKPFIALGQSVGMAAFLWGYPLLETVRTCRSMVIGGEDSKAERIFPMDYLAQKSVAHREDARLIVASATDLLYGTAWINLAKGPRIVTVPSSRRHGNRYFVMAFYDAWTNNFLNPRRGASDPDGETFALVGPGTPDRSAIPVGMRVVQSPTDLVWLIPRVMVDEEEDLGPAIALQADMRIVCPEGTQSSDKPAAVEQWVGNLGNPVDDLISNPANALDIARHFFTNLCHALVDTPAPDAEAGLLAWFKTAQLIPGSDFNWDQIPPPLRRGLVQGMADAVGLLVAAATPKPAESWILRPDIGRYGSNFIFRAVVAWRGLAGNASEVSLYGNCHFDADGAKLDGRHRYEIRFLPGQLPPVDAFWSITLYNHDRFFYPNPLGRFSRGDRNKDLKKDSDGGITLTFGHADESDNPNWIPAPEGSFYLSLRMYDPHPEAQGWHAPQVRRVVSAAT